MIWQLVAALFAGLGAAGVGLILRQLSGKRLPRWIVPVFGGLGMLGYQIHYEYSWFDNKQAQLPGSAQVVSSERTSAFWRPWTYLFPLTTAFSVVDRDNLVTDRANGQPLVEFILYRFEKRHSDQVDHQAYLLNCAERDLVPLVGDQRRPDTTALRRLVDTDPLYRAVCDVS